mmetsp:Transcript_69437/g.185274  ORF Transcript_69437/g.185274 Transcript_69437/m.185274 type:complete len:166 (-) Transcript_69437:160-657(-)
MSDSLTEMFTFKDLDVDWSKIERVSPLVDAALYDNRMDPETQAKARKLEQFYPFLVRWNVEFDEEVDHHHLVMMARLAQLVMEAKHISYEESKAKIVEAEATSRQETIKRLEEELQTSAQQISKLQTRIRWFESQSSDHQAMGILFDALQAQLDLTCLQVHSSLP